jgi:hypothetical protein
MPFPALLVQNHVKGHLLGTLHYGARDLPLDDRTLAHLQIVIGMKLRRGENFFVNWRNTGASGGGRNSIWIDNGIPIWCEFDGSKLPTINREWVETLASSASTNFGLQITEEGTLIPINSPHEDR